MGSFREQMFFLSPKFLHQTPYFCVQQCLPIRALFPCPQEDTPRGHTAHVPVLDSQTSGSRDRRILSKFKASLSYTVRPRLKKQKTTKGRGGHWAIFALACKIKNTSIITKCKQMSYCYIFNLERFF